jgi:phosphotransferase system HPr (HPr) family protein
VSAAPAFQSRFDFREEWPVIEKETTVGPEEGLHARPAARFVERAKGFSSQVTVRKGEREVNAKSPLGLMTLKARKGDSITICAEGADAEDAVDALSDLISARDG